MSSRTLEAGTEGHHGTALQTSGVGRAEVQGVGHDGDTLPRLIACASRSTATRRGCNIMEDCPTDGATLQLRDIDADALRVPAVGRVGIGSGVGVRAWARTWSALRDLRVLGGWLRARPERRRAWRNDERSERLSRRSG